MRPRLIARVAILALLSVMPPAIASPPDQAADAVLKQKGLRKVGASYVIAGEAEVQKALTGARTLYAQMAEGIAQQRAYEQAIRENKQIIEELTQQQIVLNDQLAQANGVAQHNQLVAMVNGVNGRLNLLRRQEADPAEATRIDAQVAGRREAYVQAIIELRTLVDATSATYAELAGDDAVTKAIDAAGGSSKAKATLGPSKAYLANVKLLEKAETSVLTETVSLRKEGGIFWVDVTFNGKVTRAMAWDTGAADVVLPYDLAVAIGLKPGANAPVVRARVADGSVVEARQMTIPSIRVGKFTVKDVSCTVMPADKANVPPLLGQTFQKNFTFKFSAEAGKLTLSRVETPEAGPTKAAPRAKSGTRPTTKAPAVKRATKPAAGDDPPAGNPE